MIRLCAEAHGIRTRAFGCEDCRRRIALLVRILEIACGDDALAIDDERPRMRDAVRSRPRLVLVVENAEAPDDCRPGIGDQGKRDATRVSEPLERLCRIVTNGDEPETMPADVVVAALQLDQLRLAVGSPVGRSKEDEHGAFRAE
jgi:hypothetical protein